MKFEKTIKVQIVQQFFEKTTFGNVKKEENNSALHVESNITDTGKVENNKNL